MVMSGRLPMPLLIGFYGDDSDGLVSWIDERRKQMENVYVMDHPLIAHKISRLRDERTGTNEFRRLVEEIAVLMGYEALRDLKTEKVLVKNASGNL